MIRKTLNMALIDLKKNYNGTLLGWFWLVAKPGTMIFIYWFAFSIGLRVGKMHNGRDYFFWLIFGLLPWLYISEIISSAPSIFKKYNYLVTKIKFPIILIPVFTSLSKIFVHILLITLASIIYFLSAQPLGIKIIEIIPLIIVTFITMSIFAIILSLIGSISKDISEFVKTIVTPILFLSPVLWDINKFQNTTMGIIQDLNPINFIIRGYRNIFIYEKAFYNSVYSSTLFILVMLLSSLLAISLFKNLKKEIPDYL